MTDLGLSLQAAGEHDRAKSVLRESLHELWAAGERRYIIFGLVGLARVYQSQGEPRLAVRLICAAEVQRESLGVRHAVYSGNVQTLLEALRRQLSASEFDAACAAGAAMSLEEVLAAIAAIAATS
jgi:hypothetical protein